MLGQSKKNKTRLVGFKTLELVPIYNRHEFQIILRQSIIDQPSYNKFPRDNISLLVHLLQR